MKTWWGWSLGCGTAPKLWPQSPNQDTGTCWAPLVHAPLGVPRGSTTEPQCMERASWGWGFSNWNRMLYNTSPFNWRPDTHTHSHSHTQTQCPQHSIRVSWTIKWSIFCVQSCCNRLWTCSALLGNLTSSISQITNYTMRGQVLSYWLHSWHPIGNQSLILQMMTIEDWRH
jgi:hypothetical protein